MTREEQVKICETCKHCKKDITRGILCGLTNEYGAFDDLCALYEPSDEHQAEKEAKQFVASLDESAKSSDKGLSIHGYMAIVGTYLFCLISMLVGDEANLSIIIPLYLALAFVLLALICVDYYYFNYKRKRKVFGELTQSAIEQVIKIEGYYPYKQDGDICFKSEGYLYRIVHQGPQLSLLLQGPFDGEYKIALLAATNVMSHTIIGKIHVLEPSEESPQLFITFSVESLTHYTDELRANFASYFNIVNVMLARFLEEYRQLEKDELKHNKMYDKSLVN